MPYNFKKYRDEFGYLWIFEKSKNGLTWVHMPEVDHYFKDPEENGYMFGTMQEALSEMNADYGPMRLIEE